MSWRINGADRSRAGLDVERSSIYGNAIERKDFQPFSFFKLRFCESCFMLPDMSRTQPS
jgi:hypothetical protein